MKRDWFDYLKSLLQINSSQPRCIRENGRICLVWIANQVIPPNEEVSAPFYIDMNKMFVIFIYNDRY